MDHLFGHGFDQNVCGGCPHKVESSDSMKQDTGHPVVDAVVNAYASVVGAPVDACGLCGCPLASLEKASAPPDGCPRLDQHEGR